MSVTVTAVFINVGLLCVALNMHKCGRVRALVNVAVSLLRSANLRLLQTPQGGGYRSIRHLA